MNRFDKFYKLVMESVNANPALDEEQVDIEEMEDLEEEIVKDEGDFIKYFKNGKTFSAYCRFRYGSSKKIWVDETLWENAGRYAIAFNQTKADEKFVVKNENGSNPLKPAHREAAFDDENYEERRREDMMDYIHSGAGLDAYYRDQEAGYAY